MSSRFELRLTPEAAAHLQTLKASLGLDASEVIRDLLKRAVEGGAEAVAIPTPDVAKRKTAALPIGNAVTQFGPRPKPVTLDLSADPTRPKPGTPEYSAMVGERVAIHQASQKTQASD